MSKKSGSQIRVWMSVLSIILVLLLVGIMYLAFQMAKKDAMSDQFIEQEESQDNIESEILPEDAANVSVYISEGLSRDEMLQLVIELKATSIRENDSKDAIFASVDELLTEVERLNLFEENDDLRGIVEDYRKSVTLYGVGDIIEATFLVEEADQNLEEYLASTSVSEIEQDVQNSGNLLN